MKKINLILIILFVSIISLAQEIKRGNISVKTVEYGIWIPPEIEGEKGHWDMDGLPTSYIALFKITKNIIIHIAENNKYTYFIESIYMNNEKNRAELKIVDENGANYTMIIDYKNSNLRFIYEGNINQLRLTKFVYTSTWAEM